MSQFYSLGEGVYLETEEGHQYQELFRSIRLRHIINDSASIAVLENDKIIPQGNCKTKIDFYLYYEQNLNY